MARTLMNGIRVPEGTDPFNAQGDMDAMARSIKTVIWAQDWQDAYNKANRAKWDLGWNPSPSNPDFYWIDHISSLVRYDGTRWDGTGGMRIEAQQSGDSGLSYTQPGPNEVMIMQTGRIAGFTADHNFGNGYLPVQTFPKPFPKACISITFQPIYNNASGWQFVSPLMPMVDRLTKESFRVLFPGETKSAAHALMWQAIGY